MAGLKGSSDPELVAISKVMRLLGSMGRDQALRVLSYVRMRFLVESYDGVDDELGPRLEVKSCETPLFP